MLFTNVIKKNKEFVLAYRRGNRCVNSAVCVYYYKNKTPYNALGITVGKKLGNAVERNRAKRIIRAAYRLSEKEIPLGYNIVIVAREGIAFKKSSDLERFFKTRLVSQMRKDENRKANS